MWLGEREVGHCLTCDEWTVDTYYPPSDVASVVVNPSLIGRISPHHRKKTGWLGTVVLEMFSHLCVFTSVAQGKGWKVI